MQNNVHLIALFGVAKATSLKILLTDWHKGDIRSANIEQKKQTKSLPTKKNLRQNAQCKKCEEFSVKYLIKHLILKTNFEQTFEDESK